MDDMKLFKDDVAKERGEEKAGKMAAYLSTIAMSRFFMVMGAEDPALSTPITLEGGTQRSFKQAVEELGLPPYTPSKRWVADVQEEQRSMPDFTIWFMTKNRTGSPDNFFKDPSAPLCDTYAYPMECLRQWQKEKGKPLGEFTLEGFDGLKAQVMMEGARAAGWLNSYRVQDDPQMSTTRIAGDFCRHFFGEMVQNKPALKAAIAHFDEQSASGHTYPAASPVRPTLLERLKERAEKGSDLNLAP
jgi:hypothetical protein